MGKAKKQKWVLRRVHPTGMDSHRGEYRFVALDDDATWVNTESIVVYDDRFGGARWRRHPRGSELVEGHLGLTLLAPFKHGDDLKPHYYAGTIDWETSGAVNLPKTVQEHLGGEVRPGRYTWIFGLGTSELSKNPKAVFDWEFSDDERKQCNALHIAYPHRYSSMKL